jgi:hypothetical protein
VVAVIVLHNVVVAVTVIVLHVVSQLQSSCYMFVEVMAIMLYGVMVMVAVIVPHGVMVAVAVITPRLVLQLLLLCHILCCSCCCHAAHGVVDTVIRLYGVVIVVSMPRMVSRSLLSAYIVL